MADFVDMPEDPFLTCLYDVAPVALWLHEESGATYAALDVAGEADAETLAGALALVPLGVPVRTL